MTARLFLKRVIPILGVPQIVISDRGPQFSAQFWKELLNALGAKAALATSHHPQTDGQSERGIQTFLRLIRTFASNHQSKWEEFLPLFELSINSVPAAATGFSPFEILFGRIPKLPRDFICPTNAAPDKPHDSSDSKAVALHRARWLSIWELVKNKQTDSASKMKQRYDHGRRCLDLQPGDLVLLSTKSHAALGGTRKHREKYVGPYVVRLKIHSNAYQLAGLPPEVPKTQNVQFLKLFLPSPPRFTERPENAVALPLNVQGKLEWEVESIVDHRVLKSGMRYRVKWKGTP